MAFRVRPFRPKIYEPTRKFGVVLEDGPFVILAGLAGFFIPYFFSLRLFGFPLQTPGMCLGIVGGVLFFNWMRLGKRQGHAQHWLTDLLTRGHVRRGWLPSDLETAACRRTTSIITKPQARKTINK